MEEFGRPGSWVSPERGDAGGRDLGILGHIMPLTPMAPITLLFRRTGTPPSSDNMFGTLRRATRPPAMLSSSALVGR